MANVSVTWATVTMRQNAPRETDPFKPFKHPAKMCLNSRGGLNNLISIHLVRALAAFTLSMKQVHWMSTYGVLIAIYWVNEWLDLMNMIWPSFAEYATCLALFWEWTCRASMPMIDTAEQYSNSDLSPHDYRANMMLHLFIYLFMVFLWHCVFIWQLSMYVHTEI